MRFEAEHRPLKAAVAAVAGLAATRTTIPILQHLLIEAGDGTLWITANNLDACATATCAASVPVPFAVAVMAADVTAAMKAAPADTLVQAQAEDGRLTLRAGRWSAVLPTLAREDFPLWPEQGADHEVPGAAAALPFCLPFVSTEETRYYLNGVALTGGFAVATDGHRLGAHPCEAAPGCPGVILPSDAVQAMLKPLGTGARLFVGPNQWRCEADSLVMRGKMIDGTFPDWQRVVPRDAPAVARVRATDLCAAIEAASLGLMSTMRLRIGDGAIVVEAMRNNTDRGAVQSGSAICEAETPGDLTVGLSRAIASAVFGAFGGRMVTIYADGGLTPLRVDAGAGALTVAMPLRIGAERVAA